ncbi:MAG: hydantoinase/oxoprolinase family protein, partial [Chloroflexota bacterium]
VELTSVLPSLLGEMSCPGKINACYDGNPQRIAQMLIGVDIGGTFTDFVMSDGGRLVVHKQLSTPQDPSAAMVDGLDRVTPGGLVALKQLAHGTTVATNAILERNGAKVAFLTTQGYRDMLSIGRQDRPVLYALHPTLPPALVPRALCFDVPERMDYEGNILAPLDEAALNDILDALEREAVEAVAVSLLYSYVNPIHERAIRDAILARGLLELSQIALSHEVLPEFREYERSSTVALEAYVRPVIHRYLTNLTNKLPDDTRLRVMKSDGGVVSAERAAARAVHTALSGPAAGVIGAHYLASLAGFPDIITLDMGGTSTDVALMQGAPHRRPQSEIDGLPLRIRLLDIDTVGAGGGSIARLDSGGALRVGPQSAGASPGPIAYGRGGEAVTVTDANVVLGRLDPDHFLGGRMSLDVESATRAIAALGEPAGLSTEATARGVLEIANVNIDRALRRVSVARGHDPRDFTLVAFGGAGPLHACDVADRLDIPRVLIPKTPGVLCAFGLLVADVALDYAHSVLSPVTEDTYTELRDIASELEATARAALSADGVPVTAQSVTVEIDARYEGQGYELTLPLSEDVAETFHVAYANEYGYRLDDTTVEVVNLRVTGTGTVEKPEIVREDEAPSDGSTALLMTRPDGVRLYDRDQLSPGAVFDGEAVVIQLDSTVYVPVGWRVHVDGYRNLVMDRVK